MKKENLLFFLVFCLLLSACSPVGNYFNVIDTPLLANYEKMSKCADELGLNSIFSKYYYSQENINKFKNLNGFVEITEKNIETVKIWVRLFEKTIVPNGNLSREYDYSVEEFLKQGDLWHFDFYDFSGGFCATIPEFLSFRQIDIYYVSLENKIVYNFYVPCWNFYDEYDNDYTGSFRHFDFDFNVFKSSDELNNSNQSKIKYYYTFESQDNLFLNEILVSPFGVSVSCSELIGKDRTRDMSVAYVKKDKTPWKGGDVFTHYDAFFGGNVAYGNSEGVKYMRHDTHSESLFFYETETDYIVAIVSNFNVRKLDFEDIKIEIVQINE